MVTVGQHREQRLPAAVILLLVVVVTLQVGVPSEIAGQVALSLPDSGSRLRIQTTDGSLLQGQLVASSPDSVTVLESSTRMGSRSIPLSDVEQLWLWRSRVGKGAAYGALFGGIGGALFFRWACDEFEEAFDDCTVPVAYGAAGGAVGGILIGVMIGAVASTWQLTYSASPGLPGGVAIRILH